MAEPMSDEFRSSLTPADYVAAGVDPPDWANDPFPSLETWRVWQAAENKALAHKLTLESPAPG